ncbi:hypothetical protein HU200_030419 [Digitaria exilis]|uniref:C2H2-type domain-containing protein n=1 Tax=Digitaria exilis TaxID=1010633 RepID=A0A835BP83_9POAL|nr:hypothetical protein HU200_030419 [Digitaria exilis]
MPSASAMKISLLSVEPPPQLVDDQPRHEYSCKKYVCRKCQKVFSTGYALGGHMRVHYYPRPPIGPTRKSKDKSPALLPVEHDTAVPSSPGVSLALSINTEGAPSSVPAGRVVRLFGMDIRVQAQQHCSGTTEE